MSVAQHTEFGEHPNPHSSTTRWRHQESSAYARHEAQAHQGRPIGPPHAEHSEGDQTFSNHQSQSTATNRVVCGPLLNYRRMENSRWIGSVLLVVAGGGKNPPPAPTLLLRRAATMDGRHFISMSGQEVTGLRVDEGDPSADSSATQVRGMVLYSDPRNTFFAFALDIPIGPEEAKWEYSIPGMQYVSREKPQTNSFFVPAADESMRLMFYSCNGFSVGTDEEAWSGPALWNDVLRRQKEAPFHVMIGGGDQIYNDGIRVNGPLQKWTSISKPKTRREAPYPEELRRECDDYYLNNYIRWYNTEPFASANGQIPQLSIWDDHDIIDGFGSYVDHFMQCDVFRGIGGTAHKYYLLFQHHLAPPPTSYTSDDASRTDGGVSNAASPQLVDTYVAPHRPDPGYIMGPKPGPYVAERSHNLYARLGARMALIGLDCRTERTRHQVNYPETYDLIFSRLRSELQQAAAEGRPIKHLIVLVGIPIAYPRLSWVENILRSPIMGPVKFMNRRFGFAGSFFNHFDGSIDLLDDLDDHYTAKTHRVERREFVERLQQISEEFSIRATILGGDVHLAALGRFYTKTSEQLAPENDPRFMINVVSSAIVNKPPPAVVANMLAHRNKIHHLNDHTDERLLNFFNKDPGPAPKTGKNNHCTMPSRNYAMIRENSPLHALPGRTNGHAREPGALAAAHETGDSQTDGPEYGKDGSEPLHAGELGAGTEHKAASAGHGQGHDGSLDVCIRVEIDQKDRTGQTQGYGLTIPSLVSKTRTATNGAATEGPSGEQWQGHA